MKEIEELDKINTQHRGGLVIETKKTLKSLQFLPPGGKKGELSNDELRLILNGHGRKHFVKLIESVSDVTSIKEYIPRFIIESYCFHLIEHLVKADCQ
jgi:hypothetical protein